MVNLKLDIPEYFYEEEFRNDFLVTRERKEIWAVELDLLYNLLKVCEKYDIPIYAHEAEAETLNNPSINLSGNMMGQPARYEVDNFLRDEETIKLAGFDIRVLFTPGHTPGGCCYYLPYEDLLFSGDTLFCGSVGRTDFPGGSMSQLVGAVRDKLMVLPDNTVVLTGHDSDTTIERERLYNPYL